MLINPVNLSSTIIKDEFEHIGGNIDELPNHIR